MFHPCIVTGRRFVFCLWEVKIYVHTFLLWRRLSCLIYLSDRKLLQSAKWGISLSRNDINQKLWYYQLTHSHEFFLRYGCFTSEFNTVFLVPSGVPPAVTQQWPCGYWIKSKYQILEYVSIILFKYCVTLTCHAGPFMLAENLTRGLSLSKRGEVFTA